MKNKGNYYKLRTKKWFIAKGYDCELLEKLQRIYTQGRVIFVKRDIFGADGLAMDGEEIIFWNSKFGRENIAKGIKEFKQFSYPKTVKRWVVVWEFRAKEPEIVEVDNLE